VKLVQRVPVGRRALFSEPRRAVLGIGGVAVALLLILALDGIFAGSMRQITRYIDDSPATVFVAQRGVRTMHMSSSAIPLEAETAIESLPGVTWVTPILYDSDQLGGPDGLQSAYLIGYRPGSPGGPAQLTAGSEPGSGEILLDDLAAEALGADVGGQVLAAGQEWTVSGLTTGMTSIVNTIAYVRFDDLARARGADGLASYLLVGGEPAAGLAGQIEDATGLTALAREDFAAEEAAIVGDMSVDIMRIMTLAALLIGLVVIALTMYAATLARLREIGVMKALGTTGRRLAGSVLAQAGWTVAGALVVAVALAAALSWLLPAAGPQIALVIEPLSVARVGVGAALLGALGAVAPLARVLRVDPASVFRR
jgi:putative ABC transport system permease protein